MVLLDYLWLGYVQKDTWAQEVQRIQGGTPMRLRPIHGVLAYVAMLVALLVFVVPHQQTAALGLAYGAIMGFVIYATFDATNMAIFKDYSYKTAAIDILWGMFLLGVVGALMVTVAN